jgi:Na+/phosphate symporter
MRRPAGSGSNATSDDPDAARYLDKNLLETPSLALADASRETLRMGDVVELMLRQITRCAQLCGMRRTA